MHPITNKHVGIAIVAPGGYAPDEAALARGIAMLEAQGCIVKNYYEPTAKYQRFGGTDAARIAQITDAAADPDIQIVMALRGSYGISRILPGLDFKQLAASRKLFVGYSDFTAFNMGLLAQAGAISFAGPMLCDDFTREDLSQFTHRNFWQCLGSASHSVTVQAQGNPSLEASGTLWGGNLSMLTHLIGSPYFPRVEGGILFVEDVNEHPYRVERMMLQLLHAGALQGQKAILFGDFSKYRLSDYDNGYDFEAMLAFLRSHLPVPILTGLPFGHVPDKLTLPVGGQARVVSDGTSFQLAMSGYPGL